MEPYLKATIDAYDQMAEEYARTTSNLQPQWEFESFCRIVVSGGHILDVGCGGGRDCRTFIERGFAVTGIDLSSGMLGVARDCAPTCSFVQADMRAIPASDQSFDGIWCCASLLHLDRIQVFNALIEFKRVLKPGGICCILVKKGRGEEIVTIGSLEGMPRFVTYFQEAELREQCLDLGFTIVSEQTKSERESRGAAGRDLEWICLLMRKM